MSINGSEVPERVEEKRLITWKGCVSCHCAFQPHPPYLCPAHTTLTDVRSMAVLALIFSAAFAVGLLFLSETARFTADEGVASQADKAKEAGLRSHLYAEESKVDDMTAELKRAQREIAAEKQKVRQDEKHLKQWKSETGMQHFSAGKMTLRGPAHRVYKPLHP